MRPRRARQRQTGPAEDPAGFWYAFAVAVLRAPLMALTRRDWRGQQHIPATGGTIVVTNHISHLDPLTFAHFVHDSGRRPRFLGKAVLFRVPLVRSVLRGARQIPVHRESGDASLAYRAAVDAVRQGELVVIYPEATLTRDPDLWPMAGKTGAVRVALETSAPVVPVAQWGAHLLLPPYARLPRLLPRRTIHVTAGPPVALDDLRGRPIDAELLTVATERLMAAVTGLLAEVRGERPPAVRLDPRRAGLRLSGRPDVGRRSA